MNAAEVRGLLERHGLLARRDLGQNFLFDEQLARRLVSQAGVGEGDTVIEIGTGLGTLTRALAGRATRVVTLEVDAGLVRALREEKLLPEGVELHHADALRFDLAGLVAEARPPVRVVGNLPYSISAPLLRRLLDLRDGLTDWSVMIQREVAVRLRAQPGSRDYGSLAALHGLVVRIDRTQELGARCFFPVPRVRSTFLRLTPRSPAPLEAGELSSVERVIRAAFSHRRKTLINALRGSDLEPPPSDDAIAGSLQRLGLEPKVRAERLAPEQFLQLARCLAGRTA